MHGGGSDATGHRGLSFSTTDSRSSSSLSVAWEVASFNDGAVPMAADALDSRVFFAVVDTYLLNGDPYSVVQSTPERLAEGN